MRSPHPPPPPKWRTSTGNEAFSPFTCLNGINKFVLLTFFSLIKIIYQTTTQWCKKSTSGWRPSLKNAVAKAPYIMTYSIQYLLFFQDPAVFRFKFFRHNSHDLQGRKVPFFIRLLTFTFVIKRKKLDIPHSTITLVSKSALMLML